MAKLKFSEVQNRIGHNGLDRGVLYIGPFTYVWDGLQNVSVSNDTGLGDYIYLDGIPVNVRRPINQPSYKITAFTYPDKFQDLIGHRNENGVNYFDRNSKMFSVSWRSTVSNDVRTYYRYHFLLGCITVGSGFDFSTNTSSSEFGSFVFDIKSFPQTFLGNKKTSYFFIDSRDLNTVGEKALEEHLYGSDSANAKFPDLEYVKRLFAQNPNNEIGAERNVGLYDLNVLNGDDLQGSTTVGLYTVTDTNRITEVSPGIYTF